MEDVFDVYEMPYNPVVPVVCMNEKPYQLLGEVRDSWAMRPGDGKKIDSEYARNGTCSIEYSCAVKSHFRKSGNQMSGKWKSSYARLLA